MGIRSLKNADDVGPADELLELADVCALTKQGKSTIYRQVRDGDFPKPKKLPAGAIRWTRAAYRRWVERLPEAEIVDLGDDEKDTNQTEAA